MRLPLIPVAATLGGGLILSTLAAAQAGSEFAPPLRIAPDVFPVATLDMDGDGDLDVLTRRAVTGSQNQFGWIENQGASAFGSETVIGIATGTGEFKALDFDGDGDRDLVLVQGSVVSWFERSFPSSFAAISTAFAVPNSFAADAADLDGDGDVDIAAADFLNDRIVVHMNNAGAFSAPMPVAVTGYLPVAIDCGDFDMDGDVDIAWTSDVSQGNDHDVLGLIANDGTGTAFNSAFFLGDIFGLDYSPKLVDMDGDGDLDIHTSFSEGDGLWYENQGSGGFAERMTSGATGVGPVILDVDGDGDLDTLDGTPSALNSVEWHELIVAASVQLPYREARIKIETAPVRFFPSFAIDVDGDGDQDLIGTLQGQTDVYLVRNLMNGEVGTLECDPATVNSTGQPATIAAEGSLFLSSNDLTLRAANMPLNVTGIFANSSDPGFLANPGGSQGNLCLGGAVGRYVGPGQAQNSGATGAFELGLDLTWIPRPLGFVSATAGETWLFQGWYRDTNPGPTSNFTPTVAVTLR